MISKKSPPPGWLLVGLIVAISSQLIESSISINSVNSNDSNSQHSKNSGQLVGAHRKRQNLFEPIYAFDDIDAIHVPAAREEERPPLPQPLPSPSRGGSGSNSTSASTIRAVIGSSKAAGGPQPAGVERPADSANRTANSKRETGEVAGAAATGEQAGAKLKAASSRTLVQSSDRPDFLQASGQFGQRLSTGAQFGSDRFAKLVGAGAASAPEQPKHWSALDNYYRNQQSVGQPAPFNVGQSQWDDIGDSIIKQLIMDRYRQQQQQQQPPPQSGQIGVRSPSALESPWVIPQYPAGDIYATKGGGSFRQSPDIFSGFSPPPPPPGGAGSANRRPYGLYEDLLRLNQSRGPGSDLSIVQLPLDNYPAEAFRPLAGHQQQQQQPASNFGNLPDELLAQINRGRADSQRKTQGAAAYIDPEEAYEDLFCSRSNKPPIKAAGASEQQQQLAKLMLQLQLQTQPQLAAGRPTAAGQLAGKQQVDLAEPSLLASQLTVDEFPAHVGLYNGTPGDDNFLCAATWIHQEWALTTASCVQRALLDPRVRLVARFGEWYLNKNTSSSGGGGGSGLSDQQPQQQHLLEAAISRALVFHLYRNDTQEHDLALVRFAKPVQYIGFANGALNNIGPACQKRRRSSLVGNYCWTPVRNITRSEQFDASGDGETIERRTVSMIGVPVRLIADDESECLQATGQQLFNSLHHNYICSADYKRALWRARLNQTQAFGSGIYCYEGKHLELVSLIQPLKKDTPSAYGYLDLSYYRPWIRSVVYGGGNRAA